MIWKIRNSRKILGEDRPRYDYAGATHEDEDAETQRPPRSVYASRDGTRRWTNPLRTKDHSARVRYEQYSIDYSLTFTPLSMKSTPERYASHSDSLRIPRTGTCPSHLRWNQKCGRANLHRLGQPFWQHANTPPFQPADIRPEDRTSLRIHRPAR